MEKTLITILIRTFNSENYIHYAINSALNQTISSNLYEILVIDDGSTDETKMILEDYSRKYEQIRLIFQEHKGATKTSNIGIRESFGKYLIFLDSDDEFKPKILEEMYKAVEREKADFVYCDYYEESEQGNIKIVTLKDNIFNALGGGILIEKKIFDDIGYYDEDLILPEYDILIKLIEKYKGIYIPQPMYLYKRRTGSITGDKKLTEKAIKQLEKKYGRKLSIRSY